LPVHLKGLMVILKRSLQGFINAFDALARQAFVTEMIEKDD